MLFATSLASVHNLSSLGSPKGWGWLPQDDSPLSVVAGIAGVCDGQTGWPVLFTCSTVVEEGEVCALTNT